ncbi:MAG: type I-E CRISPR-associated protein Cse1/CasA [Pseudomonadota bacterium]|jgi:CRISPR system Cascade subunit CasA
MHDLLRDELIGVSTPQGERRVDLPQLLSLLCAAEVEGYTGLRAHQAEPWHVFLVQLATAVLARQPSATPPPDPDYWRAGLLLLAAGKASAWHLHVEDSTQPAFMQHPWSSPDAKIEGYEKVKACTPDELDVLVTAKNHDVKAARFCRPDPKAWLYALLTLQTTEGYLGAGNFGIVRMNGGFASRAILSWANDLHPARRFLEALPIVLAHRADILAHGRYGYRADGVVLTWLHPWRRSDHQYTLSDLDPCFIEACRPLRLGLDANENLLALGATSAARQIGPKSPDGGDVGDPWTAINVEDKKKGASALTVSSQGFSPKLVTDLLFAQGYELSPLQTPRAGPTAGWLVGSVLVRGQGKTDGLHRLELPVPAKARQSFARPMGDAQSAQRKRLAEQAQTLLTDAKHAAAALRTALTVLAQGGPEQADFDREAIKHWVAAVQRDFERDWPLHYYPALWRCCDEDPEVVLRDWRTLLVQNARRVLDQASTRLPLPANRRWRALTQSHSAFMGVLSKHSLLPTKPEPQERNT